MRTILTFLLGLVTGAAATVAGCLAADAYDRRHRWEARRR